MKNYFRLWLFLVLSLDAFSIASAQSFTSAQTFSFDPAVYGLSSDYREIPELRTPKTFMFVNPKGQFMTVSEASEIFTHDDDGHLVPIDELGKQTARGIIFDRLPGDVRVTFDLNSPSYVYRQRDHSFRFEYGGSHPAAFIAPNTIAYRLSPHALLRFTVERATIKKEIVIDGPVDPSILRFSLIPDPSLHVSLTMSGMTLSTGDRIVLFESFAPSLLDELGKHLDHPISIRSLGDGRYEYDYETEGLPSTYVIDPNTAYRSALTIDTAYYTDQLMTWANPTNARYDDGVSATTIEGGTHPILSEYLRAYGFGFTVPDPNATIDGVTVDIDRFVSNYNADAPAAFYDNAVKLVVAGTITGDNKSNSDQWPTSDQGYTTFGGVADLWGTTLTVDDVNGTNGAFGVAFSAMCSLWDCNDPAVGPGAVDHIRMRVTGTFSAGFLSSDFYSEHYNSYVNGSCNVIGADSLEFTWCQCGYIGACGTGRYFDQLPADLSLTLANDESVNMMNIANQVGRKLLRLKKAGGSRLADFGIDFGTGTGSTYCHLASLLGDQLDQKTFAHVFKQYGENGDYFEFSQSFSGFTLYVPKAVSHDTVRVCAGKQTLGCTSSDSWSFRANDQGQIISTNGGFDTAGITVSVVNGYWRIAGLKSTGGEGQDSNGPDGGGGGGVGGYSVPEFSTAAFVALLAACLILSKTMFGKSRSDL